MNEFDDIESKLRGTFDDFEQDPPEKVWEGIRKTIHADTQKEKFRSRLFDFSLSRPRLVRLYAVLAAASVIIFLLIVFFTSSNKLTIRGHAYAGEIPLCRGTAVLFKVADKVEPIDSLQQHGSVSLNEKGFYRFTKVNPGKYLIRVVPLWNSEQDKYYHSSWNDQHIVPELSHVIPVESEDLIVDVYLMPK